MVVTSEFEMDFSKAPFSTPDEFREHMKGPMGTQPWANVPGMRSKWFWYDAEKCRCGGIYTFFNMQAVEAYKKSELFKSMWTFPFIKSDTLVVEVHENCAGGELCAEMGVWPSKMEDLSSARLLMPTFDVDVTKVPGGTMDGMRKILAGGATKPWSSVPGLYNKWFTLGPDNKNSGSGFYIFKNK